MHQGLIETAAKEDNNQEKPYYGVAVARVVNNLDVTNQGRVQLALPWLPSVRPWARVAVPMAGKESGTFFMPKEGDEVLVAFSNGNITDPYVIGSLWNGQDNAPVKSPLDAVNKRIIRTPLGHELVFDDAEKTITITSASKQKIIIGPGSIEVAADDQATTSIKLDNQGNLTLKAASTITLDAPTINISANKNVTLGGGQSARIDGGSNCSIQAAQIYIG